MRPDHLHQCLQDPVVVKPGPLYPESSLVPYSGKVVTKNKKLS
jgi:hypothetical protein